MKKITIFLPLIVALSNMAQSQSNDYFIRNDSEKNQWSDDDLFKNYYPDSIYGYVWVTAWNNTEKGYVTKNAKGLPLVETYKGCSNGATCKDYERYINTYDANNFKTSELYEEWNNTKWENSSKTTYTNNSKGNPTTELSQTWNGTAWENEYQYTYTYNANDNLLSELTKIWNGTIWKDTLKVLYTYNSSKQITNRLEEVWDGASWGNSNQTNVTYDSKNLMTETLYREWDNSNSSWIDNTKGTYTYDSNGNKTKETSQDDNGSGWENSLQINYTYYPDKKLKSIIDEIWQGTEWKSLQKVEYYYNGVSTNIIDKPKSSLSKFKIFPNPNNGNFVISIENPEIRNPKSELFIYNLLGEVVFNQLIDHSSTLQMKLDIPKGIYFINLKTENENYRQKLIIE